MGSDLTPAAVAYAWAELARRAGFDPFDPPVRLVYGGDDSVPATGAGLTVVIHRAPGGAFDELCRAPDGSIAHVAAGALYPDGNGPDRTIPLVFVKAGAPIASFVRHHDTNPTVVFDIDIIAATFFMLSRWEETVSTCADAHGRFPATASVAARQGFIDCPVVDEYALVLRAWVMRVAPHWRPSVGAFRVQLSHDVDRLFTARGWRSVVRRIVGDVVRRRDIGMAFQTTREIVREYTNPHASQSVRGLFDLASASRERGMSSTFYFIAAEPSPRNGDYDIEGHFIRSLIERLAADGFEIGLHAGYDTMSDRAALVLEYARMSARVSIRGSRQHYLRVRVPETWRSLDAVGLEYDTSMGFADCEGFRCGTCHPFNVFDIESDHPLRLTEIPLIVMDGTLRFYRGLTPVAATEAVSRLARRCRDVEGTFTLLWHNTSFGADWAGWRQAYLAMLDDVAGLC